MEPGDYALEVQPPSPRLRLATLLLGGSALTVPVLGALFGAWFSHLEVAHVLSGLPTAAGVGGLLAAGVLVRSTRRG